MFELTNLQRKNLGITLVSDSWELVKIIPSIHDENETYAYFDGDKICKRIVVGENYYMEHDLNENTANGRTELMPKTNRGKNTKLTSSTLEKRAMFGMYFVFNDNNVYLANADTNRSFYSSYNEEIEFENFRELSLWLERWIDETTKSDLDILAEFVSSKKQRNKCCEGDFFRFKINRREYGFGRIILDYDKMRKDKIKFWDILMGKALVVKIYHIATTDKNISCETLTKLKSLPSQFIMDNPIYYGEYEIIGNMPLMENECDFPVMYGNSISYLDADKGLVMLQSGMKYFEIANSNAIYTNFRNNGVGFGMHIKLRIIKECMESNSNEPYWEQNNYQSADIRNPKFHKERKAICNQFKVSEKEIFKY